MPRLRSVATIGVASAAFSVGCFGSRPVERPFYKFDGIDCRSELDAKPVNRPIHRHWQFPPPLNNAAHRFFDGCYHLLDRHVAVSLRMVTLPLSVRRLAAASISIAAPIEVGTELRENTVGPVDAINQLSFACVALFV